MDDVVYKVYFPLNPICRHLSENTKDKIMGVVPRTSTNDKIIVKLK